MKWTPNVRQKRGLRGYVVPGQFEIYVMRQNLLYRHTFCTSGFLSYESVIFPRFTPSLGHKKPCNRYRVTRFISLPLLKVLRVFKFVRGHMLFIPTQWPDNIYPKCSNMKYWKSTIYITFLLIILFYQASCLQIDFNFHKRFISCFIARNYCLSYYILSSIHSLQNA